MKTASCLLTLILIGWSYLGFAQTSESARLFKQNIPLPIRFPLKTKEIRKKTNDSTYLDFILQFNDNGIWKSINAQYRKRGNFRLKNCYYPPLKVKINRKEAANSIFEKNNKSKWVYACNRNSDANDLVLKEFIAYQLYQKLAPYYFETRLLDITLNAGTKTKALKGFLIEDIDDLATRVNARVNKRHVHPFGQDARVSIINAFFQCMIGNTDFSTGFQHNEKLLFKDGKNFPVPYDFDMSGVVNAPYATIPTIQGQPLPIEKVTQRLYRGFVRERKTIFQVCELFLQKKDELLAVFDTYRPYFEKPTACEKAKSYIASFFTILQNQEKFEAMVLNELRIKMAPLDSIP
jgi:hypothetical protein